MQTAEDLGKEVVDAELRDDLGAKRFDVFGTANFFNFKPWAAAIEHILDVGIDNISLHDASLVESFVSRLDEGDYELLVPSGPSQRSTLVFFSHRDRARNCAIHAELTRAGIDIAFRGGSLRLSPHLYNDQSDMDIALSALQECSP
jgi:selenocysteine lyase/cysteine desulfurase